MNYEVDYLVRLVAAVKEFERVFEEWMETQDSIEHWDARGLFPTVQTKDGVAPKDVQMLELDVAEAAGVAARAVQITGAYVVVAGMGTIDPIANWSLMSAPRALFTPHDVRNTAATIRGRLKSMIEDARAVSVGGIPAFSPALMHPLVWSAASAHWTTHQWRVAVREAAEQLTLHWRERLGRTDVDGSQFWNETFSQTVVQGRPRLIFPGDNNDKTARSIKQGIGPMAKAIHDLALGNQLGIRNPATHTRNNLTEQIAMEQLAACSYLARLLDRCEIESNNDEQVGQVQSTPELPDV